MSCHKCSDLVLFRWPHWRGDGGCILCLVAGLIAWAPSQLCCKLIQDSVNAKCCGIVAQVARFYSSSGSLSINIKIEGVKTAAVCHHSFQHTKPFALLRKKELKRYLQYGQLKLRQEPSIHNWLRKVGLVISELIGKWQIDCLTLNWMFIIFCSP